MLTNYDDDHKIEKRCCDVLMFDIDDAFNV